MQKTILRLTFGLFLCFGLAFSLLTAEAQAEPKTYVTLPFAVNALNADNGPDAYKSFDQAIPQMLGSRMYLKDSFHALTLPATTAVPRDEAAVAAVQASAGADYAVWGSVTVIGRNCSLDIMMRDASGTVWPHAVTTSVDDLIPTLNSVAENIKAEIFPRPMLQSTVPTSQTRASGPLNPEMMVNEIDASSVSPINPNIRIESVTSETSARAQSQTVDFAALSTIIEDLDRDGEKEIVMISKDRVYVYNWSGDRLVPRAEYMAPASVECVRLSAWDVDNDGALEIIVNAWDVDAKLPSSFILKYRNGQLELVERFIRYYMNVVSLPPLYQKVLVGQMGDSTRVFRPGVYEMRSQGGKMSLGGKLQFPQGVNVFNFAYLPAEAGSQDGDKLVMLTNSEKLRVYTDRGARQYESDESYSGSAAGVAEGAELPGMGHDSLVTGLRYFMPMQWVVADIERDGVSTLLINRPVSTASQIFNNYRFFPQGEIHALYWDGVGLQLEWKTRRIRGSVSDVALTDLDNDGKLDLVVTVVSHPGAVSMASRKTMLLVYPLETGGTAERR